MTTAKQPDRLPTNKMMASLGGVAVLYPLIGPAVEEQWLRWAPEFAKTPATTEFGVLALTLLISGAFSYWFVPDRANIPTQTSQQEPPTGQG